MPQNDAELIQQTLQGDQDAFAALVDKYQKGVHALAWRKIGDFHIAQEITQDAFLKAYQNLGDLKNRNLFAGWLYVIAARLCYDWRQKKSMPMESVDNIDASEVDKVSYSRYVAEKQAAEADETRREVVKKLLQKLPESERTVITLFYLGEMTINAIGEFLGVSPNTVKSRLSRARNRLKKEEDMIRQNIGSFQLPANLTENIMQEVSRIMPAAPTATKPVLPWVLSAASAILIFLFIGVGTQYLSRFQKPYNLNATSEPTVEIIEALFVYDSPAKPAVRTQVGSSVMPGKSPGSDQKPDAQLFAAAAIDESEVSTPSTQWIQTKGPEGGIVNSLFTTLSGDIYAGTPSTLYKLGDDGRTWQRVNMGSGTSLSLQDWIGGAVQLAEHSDMLYLATDTEILASEDKGETWNALGPHPKGVSRGFVVTDSGFYLALTEGVYYAKDGGMAWVALKDGMAAEKIHALVAVKNSVFAGTDSGLYRLNAERWELLAVDPTGRYGEKPVIHALAAAEHRLYVAAGEEFANHQMIAHMRSQMTGKPWWSLYRSTDQGDSWYPIDPRERQTREIDTQQKQEQLVFPALGADNIPSVKIFATGAGVMVTDATGELFYSMNTGETWTTLESRAGSEIAVPLLIADTNIFYKGVPSGIQRTTDGGESWHPFNTGLVGTPVMTLIAAKDRLYATSVSNRYVTSTDGGESWTLLPRDIDHGVFIAAFDDNVYVKKGNNMDSPSPLRSLSTEDNSLKFIPGMPAFQEVDPRNMKQMDTEMNRVITEAFTNKGEQNLEAAVPPNPENIDFDQLNETLNAVMKKHAAAGMLSFFGSFAVSSETYYVEYRQKLFRWKPGMAEWHDTGLIDTAEFNFPFDYSAGVSASMNLPDSMGFKIAVSGSTVYVGKRDGHLAQSFDEGDTWNDVTLDLPFPVTAFNALTFAGTTIYVATDSGVAYSSDGTGWHTATDAEGSRLVIEKFAVAGTTVYGIMGQHVYQLKESSDTWKQVTPEIPDTVLSFAVDGNVLYVGTFSSGVMRFMLDE